MYTLASTLQKLILVHIWNSTFHTTNTTRTLLKDKLWTDTWFSMIYLSVSCNHCDSAFAHRLIDSDFVHRQTLIYRKHAINEILRFSNSCNQCNSDFAHRWILNGRLRIPHHDFQTCHVTNVVLDSALFYIFQINAIIVTRIWRIPRNDLRFSDQYYKFIQLLWHGFCLYMNF